MLSVALQLIQIDIYINHFIVWSQSLPSNNRSKQEQKINEKIRYKTIPWIFKISWLIDIWLKKWMHWIVYLFITWTFNTICRFPICFVSCLCIFWRSLHFFKISIFKCYFCNLAILFFSSPETLLKYTSTLMSSLVSELDFCFVFMSVIQLNVELLIKSRI